MILLVLGGIYLYITLPDFRPVIILLGPEKRQRHCSDI